MTISERLQLHKLGYTVAEVREIAAAEKQQPAPAAPAEPAAPAAPADSQDQIVISGAGQHVEQQHVDPSQLLAAIAGLTQTLQASNILASQQPQQKSDSVEEILQQIVGGDAKK